MLQHYNLAVSGAKEFLWLVFIMSNKLYRSLAEMVSQALNSELELYPKPGLVSLIDSGSHRDMDSQTFRLSIAALKNYWYKIAELAAAGGTFSELNQLGQLAEKVMLAATNNVNTHRGAIFTLGILVAAVSFCKTHNLEFNDISKVIRRRWGAALQAHQFLANSHGSVVRRKYLVKSSIVVQAVNGFEQIFAVYQPLLAKLNGLTPELAHLQLLFVFLANIEDTNLLYRGGLDGLDFAQTSARNFLAAGGVLHPSYLSNALKIHEDFKGRNLSPGGCADLLAASIFIDQVKQRLWA